MALSRLAALLPMRWLSNVRLPQAQRCSHGANQRWRIGLDDDDLISLVEPLPAGSRAAARRGSILMACSRVVGLAGLLGTILARRSTMPSGSCMTRPTSRSTARACKVPKVMIWATRSLP